MKKFLFLLAIIICAGFIACEDTSGADKAVTCTITFDANGGNGAVPAPVTATYGEPMPEFAAGATVPTKADSIFDGYFDADDTQYYNKDLSPVKESWDKKKDTVLYAHWTPMPPQPITVDFDANGGSGGQTAPITAIFGETMPELTGVMAPTQTGYDFAGYFDAGGTQYYNADLTSAQNWDKTEAATLYAHWMAKTYTVAFIANGGSGGQEASITVTYGQPMPPLASGVTVPTRATFYFDGYFDESIGGTQYYTDDLISAHIWDKAGNATLYAQWTTGNTVVFNANGATTAGQPASLKAEYGNPMPQLASAPVRMERVDNGTVNASSTKIGYYFNEYYFDGYFDEPTTGGTKYYNADLSSSQNWDKRDNKTTLYARWTPIADRYPGIITSLAEADYTAHFAETAPVIDGKGDDPVWEKAQWKPIDQLWLSIPGTRGYPSPANFTGRYKILWTADRLYFLAEIIDDVLSITRANTPTTNPENDDCFELFISESAATGNRSGNNFFTYHISYGGVNVADYVGGSGSGVTNGFRLRNDHLNYKVGVSDSIYSNSKTYTWEVEMKIFAQNYSENSSNTQGANVPVILTEGKKMRFSAAYCDADSTNSRENFMGSVYVSGTDKNQAYKTASVYSNLYLVK